MSEAKTCPLEILVRHLSGAWTLQVIWELKNHGPQQFGKLRRAIEPISVKMLSDRLRLLSDLRLISRNENGDKLGTVTYDLTAECQELYAVIYPLYDFACGMDTLTLSAVDDPAGIKRANTRSGVEFST